MTYIINICAKHVILRDPIRIRSPIPFPFEFPHASALDCTLHYVRSLQLRYAEKNDYCVNVETIAQFVCRRRRNVC